MLVETVQRVTAEAMAKALGDEAAAAGDGGGSKPKRTGGGGRRQRAVFWEMALKERRMEIGVDAASAPRTLERWGALFIPSSMRRGMLPPPYASFHTESEVGRRVLHV